MLDSVQSRGELLNHGAIKSGVLKNEPRSEQLDAALNARSTRHVLL